MSSKVYDYEQDKQEDKGYQQLQEENRRKLQELQGEHVIAQINVQIKQLNSMVKSHENKLKKMEKDMEQRITEHRVTEVISLINSGILTDPNIIKLLKTKQFMEKPEQTKLTNSSLLFSRKLNQISESLTILYDQIKKVDRKATTIELEISSQLNQKFEHIQREIEEMKTEQAKEIFNMNEKIEVNIFDQTQKARELETKTNWKLNEFKSKIDDKINQQHVKIYLEDMEIKIDKNMKQYQNKCNIDPYRIDKMEQTMESNRMTAQNRITQCNFLLNQFRTSMDERLLEKVYFEIHKGEIEKRMNLFNANFNDVFSRVQKCEKDEIVMDRNITKLLKDTDYNDKQVKRINTVLVNLKIGQDFQQMLEKMNPSKVLQLQNTVEGITNEQGNIFKQIQGAKRQIDKIKSKNQIQGLLLPNKTRQKLKKQELHQALDGFLTQNQFAKKINIMERQLSQYKTSIDSINILNKKVSRIQKQSQYHNVIYEMKGLEDFIKKQLTVLHSKFRDNSVKTFQDKLKQSQLQSQKSKSINNDVALPRSFSSRKVNAIKLISNSKIDIIGNKTMQLEKPQKK